MEWSFVSTSGRQPQASGAGAAEMHSATRGTVEPAGGGTTGAGVAQRPRRGNARQRAATASRGFFFSFAQLWSSVVIVHRPILVGAWAARAIRGRGRPCGRRVRRACTVPESTRGCARSFEGALSRLCSACQVLRGVHMLEEGGGGGAPCACGERMCTHENGARSRVRIARRVGQPTRVPTDRPNHVT